MNLLAAVGPEAASAADPVVHLVIPALLLALAMGFFFLEVLFPSMGLLTLMGVGSIAGSLVLAFRAGGIWGVVCVGITLAAIPVTLVIAFKVLRLTGAVLETTSGPSEKSAAASGATVSPGDRGVAVTSLRPSGKATFGSRRVSVVTTGRLVDPGGQVEVTRVEGTKVVVKPVVEG